MVNKVSVQKEFELYEWLYNSSKHLFNMKHVIKHKFAVFISGILLPAFYAPSEQIALNMSGVLNQVMEINEYNVRYSLFRSVFVVCKFLYMFTSTFVF